MFLSSAGDEIDTSCASCWILAFDILLARQTGSSIWSQFGAANLIGADRGDWPFSGGVKNAKLCTERVELSSPTVRETKSLFVRLGFCVWQVNEHRRVEQRRGVERFWPDSFVTDDDSTNRST